ncbi:MAG: tetratricopeptide repeat protein [Chitinophagaceae bacterium]|nr:tetratricopeptide repeat protein [Chitinophagaceae bacterium]
MKSISILICSVLLVATASAEKVYDFNSVCQQAYQEITKLKIDQGLLLVQKARKQNPENLIPILLEDYADFFRLFFNEDPADFKKMMPNFSERLDLLADGPKNSPFYNFCLSSVRIHKAAVEVKFGQNWSAGWDFRKAYILLKENKKNYPDFVLNDLMSGSLTAIIGTVPSGYKWIVSLFGMRGSIVEGMKVLRAFTYSNDPLAKLYFNESAFVYPYLLFYIENKKEEAILFIQQKKLDIINNHLFCFMAANLAINNKQTTIAGNFILNRNPSADYLKSPIWDFEMGFVKLYRLDLPDAIRYLEQFQKDFKGNFYKKDALLKLSYAYYLQGNMVAAEAARKAILKKGVVETDADKKAMKEARLVSWPNPLLLKARYLSDGGFHKEALLLLQGKTSDQFNKEDDKLEFVYRVARIYDDLGRKDDAIKAYQSAIVIGEHRKEYYAARAAVQIGQIYEERGQKSQAIIYYQKCLDMDDHDYKDSLDQRAKSGISRCKGE